MFLVRKDDIAIELYSIINSESFTSVEKNVKHELVPDTNKFAKFHQVQQQ